MRYFDAHCDTLTRIPREELGDLLHSSGHVDLTHAQQFEQYAQLFAIWTSDDLRGREGIQAFEHAADWADDQFDKQKDRIMQCRTAQQYRHALKAQKAAAILTVEGGHMLGGELAMVQRMFDRGVRALTLTWNGDNELASGCRGSGGGLTQFGLAVIDACNRLGIAIDVSHLNDRGFFQVLDRAQRVFATHSNARAVCAHPRNLTDEMLRALFSRQSGCGINFYPPFLNESGKAGVFDIVRHVEHIMELGGEKHLFFGADFDGIETMPDGCDGLHFLPEVYHALEKEGITSQVLDDLCYGNLERLMLRFLPME